MGLSWALVLCPLVDAVSVSVCQSQEERWFMFCALSFFICQYFLLSI